MFHSTSILSQISNPGFESGNLTGWTSTPNVTVTSGLAVMNWTIQPHDYYMASIKPTDNLMISAAETNLGLPAGSLVNFNQGVFSSAANFGILKQQIYLYAGQTITVYWNYFSQDFSPYNDGVLATLVGPSSYINIKLLAVTLNAYGSVGTLVTGSYGSTNWHPLTFTAGVSGVYTLGFASFNNTDQGVDPILLIDDGIGGTFAPGYPIVITYPANTITSTTAVSGGNVLSDGGAAVFQRGICWNTTGSPTLNNSFVINGSGVGSFISNLSNLSPGTTYYVRAFAMNSVGTSYGNEVSFTTLTPPSILCPSDIYVQSSANQCGMNVTFPSATATGNPLPSISYSHTSGSFFPVGTTTVTATATNAAGSASCNFKIHVSDITPPSITCPGNQILPNCVSYVPDFTSKILTADNCNSSITITQVPAPGTPIGLGTSIPITCTAKDASNNYSTCSFILTRLNDIPVNQDDHINVCAGNKITFNVLSNDNHPQSIPLIISDYTLPSDGTLIKNADNTFTYITGNTASQQFSVPLS